jgi:dTMP kinase
MTRAAFFALEGIDGTGKSTQCRKLVRWLQEHGVAAQLCADPGGTQVGDRLRSMLLELRAGHDEPSMRTEALMFMASRAELVARVIEPALAAGTVVVTDRFLLSNVAYQGHAGGIDPAALWQTGLLATNGLEPDLTIVLDLPVEEAARRRERQSDRVEARSTDYHERVRQGYLAEARARPERICVIDAAEPEDTVQERIRAAVRATLSKRLP